MKILLFFTFGLHAMCALIDQTTSSLGVLSVLVVLYCLMNMRKSLGLMIAFAISVMIFLPELNLIMERSRIDVFDSRILSFGELMTDGTSRILLTGRVGLWQDVWAKFNDGSVLQQIFGRGESSNAHSSYFYLLLMIGYGGLLFYVGMHLVNVYYFMHQKYSFQVG